MHTAANSTLHLRYVSRVARHGFTAVELMVTLAILAILSAIAMPSFRTLFERWRVLQATESLKSSLMLARSEAIKRGGKVVIQKIANNTDGCTTATNKTDWDCGWIICNDSNNSGTCTQTDPVLQIVNAPRDVQITRSGGAGTIKLNRWGLVDGAFLSFSIVPLNKSTANSAAKGLCMSSGGRIRLIPSEEIPCTS
ncbi:GspH/FimT family pseudopilin [Comamonas sp. C11]|uniref:GspH/FimT family pseudopilin n=1 Tax=Comamonas sp. C11 TaxID=2966554 RepID=UPI002112BF3C|nr:GspH/FimT family pseudopilin [Comamonas sp. C11]UUC94921.1 GspH/FimT family pseudopilin [Comamonas sp. C11]